MAMTSGKDDVYSPKKVVLKPEEVEKMADRLYGRSADDQKKRREKFEADLKEQFEKNRRVPKYGTEQGELPAKQQEALRRLYEQPMQRKQHLREADEKQDAKKKAEERKIQPEEVDQLTDRLYTQSVKRKEASLAQSTAKVYGSDAKAEPKRLDKAKMADSVDSLYTKALERKKANHEALSAKYLFHRLEGDRLSQEQVQDLGTRLATKSGK